MRIEDETMSRMTRERFEALADAWGGDLRRWPEVERGPAERLRAADPSLAGVLESADALDALLHAAPRPVVSAALRDRVLAAAPKPRRGGFAKWAVGRNLGWSLGAGWAATACAGVAAGVLLTHYITADARADAVLYQAGLSPVDDTEVLG